MYIYIYIHIYIYIYSASLLPFVVLSTVSLIDEKKFIQ